MENVLLPELRRKKGITKILDTFEDTEEKVELKNEVDHDDDSDDEDLCEGFDEYGNRI